MRPGPCCPSYSFTVSVGAPGVAAGVSDAGVGISDAVGTGVGVAMIAFARSVAAIKTSADSISFPGLNRMLLPGGMGTS